MHAAENSHVNSWQYAGLRAASDILVLKLISVLVFILFSSQNIYFI